MVKFVNEFLSAEGFDSEIALTVGIHKRRRRQL